MTTFIEKVNHGYGVEYSAYIGNQNDSRNAQWVGTFKTKREAKESLKQVSA